MMTEEKNNTVAKEYFAKKKERIEREKAVSKPRISKDMI